MTSTSIAIHGTCDPRFAPVREAFAHHMDSGGELGAAVAVTIGNELLVDLWAGYRDGARSRPWERETIVHVYSATKGMTALCAHILADRGQLDFDAPVARYWPEFAQAGKERVPVRWLLSHRVGLPAVRAPLPREAAWSWESMTAALAAETPWWEPGTTFGYHAVTFGWLVGEVVRRISGKSLGTFFRDEVAQPFGIDFQIGLPASEDARVAEMVPALPTPGQVNARPAAEPNSMRYLVSNNPVPFLTPETANTREFRAAELGGVGGHGSARALAQVYGILASGGELGGKRLLSRAAIDRLSVEESVGTEAVNGTNMRFSLGFMLPSRGMVPPAPVKADGSPGRLFGHPGAGGSQAFAAPDAQLGFGWVMNRMGSAGAGALARAVYASL